MIPASLTDWLVAKVLILGSLVIASAGSVGTFALSLAQNATADPQVLTYASGASGVAAVGALVYVAKLFARGEVVAREPSEVERQMLRIIAKQDEQIDALHDLTEKANQREDRLWTLLSTQR